MQAYENLKKKAKKAAAVDKVERVKTGGGQFEPQVTVIDEKLLAVLGNRATPLANMFDSDTDHHGLATSSSKYSDQCTNDAFLL